MPRGCPLLKRASAPFKLGLSRDKQRKRNLLAIRRANAVKRILWDDRTVPVARRRKQIADIVVSQMYRSPEFVTVPLRGLDARRRAGAMLSASVQDELTLATRTKLIRLGQLHTPPVLPSDPVALADTDYWLQIAYLLCHISQLKSEVAAA